MLVDLNRLQWLALIVWLAVLLLFFAALVSMFFGSRSARLHLRFSWLHHGGSSPGTLKPLIFSVAVAIAAALLVQFSNGESWPVRLALVLVGAGVAYALLDWTGKRISLWIEANSARSHQWALRRESARTRLQDLLDPGSLHTSACQLLQEDLQVSHASLFMRQGVSYRQVASSPPQSGPSPEFPFTCALHRELTRGHTFQPLRLRDERSGAPLRWSLASGAEWEAEQARLAPISAYLAAPLQQQQELQGFFLLGPPAAGAAFGPAHLEYAVTVARLLLDALSTASAAQELIDRSTEHAHEQAHEQASRRIARTARIHLAPPQRSRIEGFEFGANYWLGETPGGAFFDIIALPHRTAVFLLADIPGPQEDAAVRLVQVQALLRSRAWTYGEDPAELVKSTARALALSLANHPPISCFCLRPIPGARRVQFLNAGHLPPIVVRRTSTGTQVTRLVTGGPAIGEIPQAPYQAGELELEPGDLVAIASRGLVEASDSDGRAWGESRLVDSLMSGESLPMEELAGQVLRTAAQFADRQSRQPPRFLITLRACFQPSAASRRDPGSPDILNET